MEKYYLVARNKQDEDFIFLPFRENWYLQGSSNAQHYALPLEAIDLVTMKFSSKEQLITRLYQNKYISSMDVDLFIVKKRKWKEKESIKFYEVIYNPEQKSRIQDLKDIAIAFLNGEKEKEKDKIDLLFNKCIHKAATHPGYREMLTDQMTPLPTRFTDAFFEDRENYFIKYQNQGLLQSYPAIRSIVESLNRADLLDTLNGDFIKNGVAFLNENGSARVKIIPRLLQKLDPNYIEGQIDVFSLDFSNIKPKEEPPIEKSMTEEEKKQWIMQIFFQIPFGLIEHKNHQLTFHFEKLPQSQLLIPLEEQAQLKRLLDEKLGKALYLYSLHKNEYQKALSYFENTDLLEQELREDRKDILKLLEDTKIRNNAYNWCQIYSNYQHATGKGDDNSGKRR